MCSPKKSEVLLPEAGRMDFEQEKQQMSPSAAERFGQIKSFWEARHANQIQNRAAPGMPACRRVCSGESILPEHSLCILNATFLQTLNPRLVIYDPPLIHLSQRHPFSTHLKATFPRGSSCFLPPQSAVFSEGYFIDIALLKSSEKPHIWKILHIILLLLHHLLLLLLFTLSFFWRPVKHIYTLKALESSAGTSSSIQPRFP